MTPGSLRALLLTLDFPPTHGGIQTMAREICARARRTELRVIAPADAGWRDHDATVGVPVERVRATIAAGRRGYVPAVALAARKAIKRWRPDVVLAMHVLAAPAAVPGKRPLVTMTHGGELRSKRIRPVARAVLSRSERVVANSRFTRSLAVALGADPFKTTVLLVGAPDPVEVGADRIEQVRADIGGRYVLSVARLEPHKGQDRLISAIRELPDDVRAVLVGEGSARADLESLAREIGVSDRVRFAGRVDDGDLPTLYAAADAFALLSRETTEGVEGGGIALLEACAYGLPVVAGATGGIPETIRDAETGLLVDPDEVPSVVRGLRRVLEDRSLAAALGSNARAMAVSERGWGRFVERIEDLLFLAARRSGEVVG